VNGIDAAIINQNDFESIVFHPNYTKSKKFENNIALLKLKETDNVKRKMADGTLKIHTVCTPKEGSDYAGHLAWIAGWGISGFPLKKNVAPAGSPRNLTDYGFLPKGKPLQEANITILANNDTVCNQMNDNTDLPDNMYCAPPNNGTSTSLHNSAYMGDEGGPLALEELNADKTKQRWTLAGIIGGWEKVGGNPGTQSSQFFTKVSSHLSWIKSQNCSLYQEK